MSRVLKVIIGVIAVVVIVAAGVIGYGVYQLSRLHPDAEGGRALGAEIESELGTEHPDFRVDTAASSAFAELVVTIQPAGGDLTEPEISDLLASLQELTAEHASSPWSLKISIEGRWETTPVEIVGSAADQWPELSRVLEVASGSRTALTLSLDTGRVHIDRDLDTERLCGAGTDPQDFFPDAIEEANDALTELGWTDPGAPVLTYGATGCDRPLRVSLDLSGEDRVGRLDDVRAVADAASSDHTLKGIIVLDTGDLLMSVDGPSAADLAVQLDPLWPHGEVSML